MGGVSALGFVGLSARAEKEKAAPGLLAGQVQAILRKHCFECHGRNPRKIKGDGLDILDHALLLDTKHKRIVPRFPDESKLLEQVNEELMPPGRRPKLSLAERKALHDWIAAGAPPFPAENDGGLAARVKALFKARCFECHGGTTTSGGVEILNRKLLVGKKKVVPGKPDESLVFRVLTAEGGSAMPKDQPRLNAEEVDLVRAWIAADAPAFPDDVTPPAEKEKDPPWKNVSGQDYIHKKILARVRKAKAADVPFLRFFSLNHLLTAGATPDKLQMHRQALAKAINHLTWKRELVQPASIDSPTDSIYAVDIRKLGWDTKPFVAVRGKDRVASEVNLFDLVVLEYPYAMLYDRSKTFDALTTEFLRKARQVRPVVYLRADWFVSMATQSPLYEDLLQLPWELKDLEKRLEVAGKPQRAGMTRSGISQNNRVVERREARHGSYWRSYDYRSSKGDDNIFRNPVTLRPAGGEMIFSLPNGLQGYFITNGQDVRIDSAPTDIVTDPSVPDKTVRNGLSCMRCHEQGMKPVEDAVRRAFELLPARAELARQVQRLYPLGNELDESIKTDRDRFAAAMKLLDGELPRQEPIAGVSKGFLDDPLYLSTVAGELGYPAGRFHEAVFEKPRIAALGLMPLAVRKPVPGAVRRDAWEDDYDRVVRALDLATPVVPLDGLLRRDYRPEASDKKPALDVALSINRKVVQGGDRLVILVKNNSKKPIYIEVVLTGDRGQKVQVEVGNPLRAGGTWHSEEYKVSGEAGKEHVTLFASDEKFPPGVILEGKDGKKGAGVADRFVHPFYPVGRGNKAVEPPAVLKKTIEFETR
jgi:serine/threonine-protein kinase